MVPLLIAGGAAIAGGVGSWMSAKNQQIKQQQAMDQYSDQMQGYMAGYDNSMHNNIEMYDAMTQQYLNTPSGVSKWLNPNMDYQMQQIANMNSQQYGAGGKMLSGAAMKSLQDRGQNQAKLSWNDAFNQMNASNNQGLAVVGNSVGMRNDLASNMFNAQQGMAGNQLTAAMGQRQEGFGDFLQGAATGASAIGSLANAFRPKASTAGANVTNK